MASRTEQDEAGMRLSNGTKARLVNEYVVSETGSPTTHSRSQESHASTSGGAISIGFRLESSLGSLGKLGINGPGGVPYWCAL